MKRLLTLTSFYLITLIVTAQSTLHLTLVTETDDQSGSMITEQIKKEINTLLSSSYQLTIEEKFISYRNNLEEDIREIYQEATDIIIGVGFNTCIELSKLTHYRKPTILTFILDNEIQNIPITSEGNSGVNNLTYIQSPFNIARDLNTLYELKPYKKLAVIGTDLIQVSDFDFDAFMKSIIDFSDKEYQFFLANGNVDNLLAKIPEDVEAIYVFPLMDVFSDSDTESLLHDLSERGLPTMSLLSNPFIELGGYAAYESDDNLQRIPRRVALNVMKIAEGQEASTLPVIMDNFTENLIINMKTAKHSRHFPNWDIMSNAVLVNVTESEHPERSLTFYSAIAEGLENNLGLRITNNDYNISNKEVSIAKSNFLPQVDASSTALLLDDNSVRAATGTKGYINWSAKANLSQVILSEPAVANVAIQKLLLESDKQAIRQNELDVVIDVADAYLNILKSTELVKLRNENTIVTRKNYDIAKAKEKVGYSGTSDVYRWESELALDNADLNGAQATLRQARFSLNALLNRPIKEVFEIRDIQLTDNVLLVLDNRLLPLINNPGDIEVFADFLVEKAFKNLPELKQIEAGLAIEKRSLLSQNRAFYIPQIALQAEYNYPINNYIFPEGVSPLNNFKTYSAALGIQIPIFQGNSRKYLKEQSQISIEQLKDQTQDLKNQLELRIRANIETAGASYSNLALSREASYAAQKNFEIAQNSYQQGLLNVTSLIDAQNAFIQTQINATNAAYTFISDFLAVERSVGYFHFLAPPQQQDEYLQSFINFLTKK